MVKIFNAKYAKKAKVAKTAKELFYIIIVNI